MNQGALVVLALLSFVSLCLYVLGGISGMQRKEIRYFPWIVNDRNDNNFPADLRSYWGLTVVYLDYGDCNRLLSPCDDEGTEDSVIEYSSCADNSDTCQTCEKYGLASLILTCAAFGFSFLALLSTFSRLSNDSRGGQVMSSLSSILSSFCGIVAIGLFHECFQAIDDDPAFDTGKTLYGNSAIMVIVALLLIFFTGITHLALTPEPKHVIVTRSEI